MTQEQLNIKVMEIYKLLQNKFDFIKDVKLLFDDTTYLETRGVLAITCNDSDMEYEDIDNISSQFIIEMYYDSINEYIAFNPTYDNILKYIPYFTDIDKKLAFYVMVLLHEIGHIDRINNLFYIGMNYQQIIDYGETFDKISRTELKHFKESGSKINWRNEAINELYADKFAYMNFPKIINLLK